MRHGPVRRAWWVGLTLVAAQAAGSGLCWAQEEKRPGAPDEVRQAVRAVRHFQELEVLPEDAPDLPSVDDLVPPLSVLQQAADESPDLDVKLLALLYAIDCYRSLGDEAEEAQANERFLALLKERGDQQLAWRHVNAYAQHRLFRGLRVVSFTNQWGHPEEKLFDTELVRQAAQAYEKLAEWFPETDLAPKALDKAAWIYYACLNDYDVAIPLCERIAQQWPQTDYHLRAEWRLGMMYFTMGPHRDARQRMRATTPEEFRLARTHLEHVRELGPDTPEAQFAQRAIEGLVVVGTLGADSVAPYSAPNGNLPGEIRVQISRIMDAARGGMEANERVAEALREEFLARLGRWLETVLREPLPAEDLEVVARDLRWAPAGPGLLPPNAPRHHQWVLSATYAAQRAISRFLASQEWAGALATRQDRRVSQAQEARFFLEGVFEERWPDVPTDMREACMAVLERHLGLCAQHPLWGELPLPLRDDALWALLLACEERLAGPGWAPPGAIGLASVEAYERRLLTTLRECLGKHVALPVDVGSAEENELRQLMATYETARTRRVRRSSEGGEARLAFDDSPLGRHTLVWRESALFLLRPFWLRGTEGLLAGRAPDDTPMEDARK